MIIKTYGGAVIGVNATKIDIEVSILNGNTFQMVGLPDKAIQESKIRIETVIRVLGDKMPGKRIVVNMAPADLKKEGSAYDLTIAIGIIASLENMHFEKLGDYLIMGELSLDGTILPIRGALPIAIMAKEQGFKGVVFPSENACEAAIVSGIEVYGFDKIHDVIDFLNGHLMVDPVVVDTRMHFKAAQEQSIHDFSDVSGQENIKRAMEIAAAGGHNLMLIGPPGAGKTMLAKRLSSILPPLTLSEALETTKIHSVAGRLGVVKGLVAERPFRAPHHTISDVALIGGGTNPQPGEVSLAHNGVLFLDELPEFKRNALEVLRQPLEDRTVTISRAKFTVDYPSNVMLIASMNPCSCGYYNHPDKDCICPPGAVQKYLSRISGPLMDRIDLHVEVVPVPFSELSSEKPSEKSIKVRERVVAARQIQINRYQGSGIHSNAQMDAFWMKQVCVLDDNCKRIIEQAMNKLNLSARAYNRILKVARTIADIDNSEVIKTDHLAEAIQYRSLDRDNWGS